MYVSGAGGAILSQATKFVSLAQYINLSVCAPEWQLQGNLLKQVPYDIMVRLSVSIYITNEKTSGYPNSILTGYSPS